MPGPLDRRCQHPLMAGAVSGDPARHNFAPFIHKSLKQSVIMIIDDIDFIFTEAADPLSSSVKISHVFTFVI